MREELRRRLADRRSGQGGERAATISGLARLEEADREVLLLAGWEELEPREIAAVLGISTIAARSRLHRARRRLRIVLTQDLAPQCSPGDGGLECEEAR